MKIAIYSPDIPSVDGGAYSYQQSLLEGLAVHTADSAHEFVIYTGRLDTISGIPGVELVRLPGDLITRIRNRAGILASAIQQRFLGRVLFRIPQWLERDVRARHVDVVWFLTHHFQECGVPFIYTVWDLQHLVQPWFPEVGQIDEWNHRRDRDLQTILRAIRTIVPNQAARREIQAAFGLPDERLLILPLPTPSLRFVRDQGASDVQKKYDLPPDYLFYPAQFWPHKNHVNLLRALRLLHDRGQNLSVVLCGSDKGNETHVQHTAKQLGLSRYVRNLGFVPSEDLSALYSGAFALTFVSFFGPENLPPLEAQALGCPVICSRYAGSREQLGDGALYVDPSDPYDIARAVISLKSDPALRQQMIDRGLERQRWTGRDYVGEVIKFLDEFSNIRGCWSN